ncbi:MAG: bifunctional DNA-formamidopyrimidine glycosylase/DNA-(apurinic or apyrimidinic site) lyase [Pseudomonadota bacterium]|nr:bifunctional DNA-formamidopyrimidine glycosylase/DNA-(apurinic or apyrimidinic site) lyase [Pseudomonadota bacterium]
MPELPEVEVTRLSFADRIAGARVVAVRLGKPLRWPIGVEPARLVGQRVGAVTRRGKYLWLALDTGGLLIHLGMSGALSFGAAPEPGGHDHFDLVTDRGTLRLTDPRRFGAVVWSPALDAAPALKLLATLGVEPFDPAFDGAYLHAALRRRRVAVKVALLGGRIVVGAGNIYACEALFEARIDPRTRSDRISRPRAALLADAVRTTLARAVELGGSTLRNYRDAQGTAGEFQLKAAVYGRAGKPCQRCGTPIRRIVQAGRATFYCPRCQRR